MDTSSRLKEIEVLKRESKEVKALLKEKVAQLAKEIENRNPYGLRPSDNDNSNILAEGGKAGVKG